MKIKQFIFVTGLLLCTQLLFAQSMHDAIKSGDIEVVKSLVKSDSELLVKKYPIEVPFNRFMPKEVSPLFDAIHYGRFEIIQYFIEQGVDLKKDNYAIYLAVLQKEERTKQFLIKNGARITNDTTPHRQPNILAQAVVLYSEIEILEELIELGASVNVDWGADGNYAHTALGLATRRMLPKVVKLLIENGAEINKQNGLLHHAISDNREIPKTGYSPELLYYLLEYGVDKNERDENGDTPFEYAAIEGVILALKILWDNTYDVSQTNFDGMTLLHRTVIKGYFDNVEFLVSKGFALNVKDNYGNTPLFYANKYGHKKIADLLKTKGGKTSRMPVTERTESLLNKKLKDGQAYIWYLGRIGWAVKTNNYLIVIPYDWNEIKPDNASMANGSIVPKELFNQNIIIFGYGSQRIAETLVAKTPYLKTKSQEKNITYIFSSKPSESKHISSIKINNQDKKEIGNAVIRHDNYNWLFIADGVKILFNWYSDPKNKEFLRDAKNPDISFFNISGNLGNLPEEDIAKTESNIEIFQPKMMLFSSIYSSYYSHQEMSNQLKKRGCKIKLPVAKFPGDFFFYDASASEHLK